MRAMANGLPKERWPKLQSNVEWVATMSADRTSLSVLMVNTNGRRIDMPIELKGYEFAGEPVVRSVTIPAEHVYSHLIPGERPLWQEREERRPAMSGASGALAIEPNTVQSVTVPIRTK
jgi:hypothetical protein